MSAYGTKPAHLVRIEEDLLEQREDVADEIDEFDIATGSVWPKWGELDENETPHRLAAACDRVYRQYKIDSDERHRRGRVPIDCLTGLDFDPSSVVPEVEDASDESSAPISTAPPERAQKPSMNVFGARVVGALRHARFGLPIGQIAAKTRLSIPDVRKALLELLNVGTVRMGDGAFWKLEEAS